MRKGQRENRELLKIRYLEQKVPSNTDYVTAPPPSPLVIAPPPTSVVTALPLSPIVSAPPPISMVPAPPLTSIVTAPPPISIVPAPPPTPTEQLLRPLPRSSSSAHSHGAAPPPTPTEQLLRPLPRSSSSAHSHGAAPPPTPTEQLLRPLPRASSSAHFHGPAPPPTPLSTRSSHSPGVNLWTRLFGSSEAEICMFTQESRIPVLAAGSEMADNPSRPGSSSSARRKQPNPRRKQGGSKSKWLKRTLSFENGPNTNDKFLREWLARCDISPLRQILLMECKCNYFGDLIGSR
ncbi:amyloid beta A4 precursor protein-binding family B member 1-interacting protein-like [Procambarus clarkii]|uniref:amyloid beta A4 precursor protein-binding family B member 1-interacting protein-like n=1 Tax=Procambarus clarkii TaxID=6728 RepID=UPI0037423A8F